MKKLALFLPLLAWLLAGCTPAVKPQLGFFYNEDGTFSPGFDSIRQPQGIVFDMKAGADSSWCYVLSLQEFNLPLTDVSSVLDGVASPDSLCGEENTKVWVKSLGKDSPIVNRARWGRSGSFPLSVNGDSCVNHTIGFLPCWTLYLRHGRSA